MTESSDAGKSSIEKPIKPHSNDNDSAPSQRVFKKSSPNSMLTLYLPTRELVSCQNKVEPLNGVLHVDKEFAQGHRVYGQLTLTFRYGREDEEVMGLRFCNEAVMCLTQIWPQVVDMSDRTLTPLQEALVKRLGDGALPFTMELNPQAPPSVQLVPAKRYYGAPIGTSYDVRCYVADRSDEKLHRRSTVRMSIRVIQKTDLLANILIPPENSATLENSNQCLGQSSSSTMTMESAPQTPGPFSNSDSTTLNKSPFQFSSTSSSSSQKSKAERSDSFSKLKLSPKAFRFTGKLCRSKSEIEKDSPDTAYFLNLNDVENSRGPQGAVDKPFLLQDGRVGLRASLDKSIYAHGEKVTVTVHIRNDSRKTVRRIRVFAIQHVDVCMFSNGKFKNIVADVDQNDQTVAPGASLDSTFILIPHRGPTKNWIALEDSLQRSNEPKEIKSSIASSALRSPNFLFDDKNVFAIYVSYYVKVKLTLSGMGGELSLKLPFTLAHFDQPSIDSHPDDEDFNQKDDVECDTPSHELQKEESMEMDNNLGANTKVTKPREFRSTRLRKDLNSLDRIEPLSDDEMDEKELEEFKKNFQNRQITEIKSSSNDDSDLLEEVFEDSMTLDTNSEKNQNRTSSVSSVSSMTTISIVASRMPPGNSTTTSGVVHLSSKTGTPDEIQTETTTFVQIHAPLSS